MSSETDISIKEQQFRIEKVAPENGIWAYLVAIGLAIPSVSFSCCQKVKNKILNLN